MKRLLLILMILLSGVANAQFIYVDPAVAGAQTAHSSMINNRLKDTNEKLSLIEKGQLAVTAELAVVNTMQEKIYKGLSEVNAVLTNLYEVKEIHRVASGIISDISDMMD